MPFGLFAGVEGVVLIYVVLLWVTDPVGPMDLSGSLAHYALPTISMGLALLLIGASVVLVRSTRLRPGADIVVAICNATVLVVTHSTAARSVMGDLGTAVLALVALMMLGIAVRALVRRKRRDPVTA